MANQEHRLAKLRGHLQDVHDELYALPPEERDGHETSLVRLDCVVGYAGAMLDATDPRLISPGTFTTIQSAACRISNSPRAALDDADACADALVDAIALLPSPRAGEDEQQAERQKQAFEESQRANAAEFQAGMDAFRAELERTQQQARDELDERVDEIKRMESETATLVEAIAIAGTWENCRRQGGRQRIAAEVLRGLTVVATLAAVAVALLATARTDPTTQSSVANVFAALLLVGLAAYFARQSARHRAREEEAARVQFELAAFSPFIEALTPEQREYERVMMTRKLFGTTAPGLPFSEEDDAALGFLSRRKRRKAAQAPSAEPEAALAREGSPPTNGSAPL